MIPIEQIIRSICAHKERSNIHPSYALHWEIKSRVTASDKELECMLSEEVEAGVLRRWRTLNGYAYAVA